MKTKKVKRHLFINLNVAQQRFFKNKIKAEEYLQKIRRFSAGITIAILAFDAFRLTVMQGFRGKELVDKLQISLIVLLLVGTVFYFFSEKTARAAIAAKEDPSLKSEIEAIKKEDLGDS